MESWYISQPQPTMNSGFENGTASWQKQGSWDFESVSKAEEPDNVYAGDYAALVPVRAATAFPYQTVQLEADKTYISSVAISFKSALPSSVGIENF